MTKRAMVACPDCNAQHWVRSVLVNVDLTRCETCWDRRAARNRAALVTIVMAVITVLALYIVLDR